MNSFRDSKRSAVVEMTDDGRIAKDLNYDNKFPYLEKNTNIRSFHLVNENEVLQVSLYSKII